MSKPTVNTEELKDLLKTAFEIQRNVLIVSPPGCGKTAIVKEVFGKMGVPLILRHAATDDPTDWKGMPAMDNGKARFVPFEDCEQLMNAKERTVVFPDDLGQTPISVQASMMQPMHGAQLNSRKYSKNLVWIGATNDTTHMSGVGGIIEPIKSRFDTIVYYEPDVDGWSQWAVQAGMPLDLIAYMRKCPDRLCDFKPTRELTNGPNPRNWESVGAWVNAGCDSDAVLAGAVGQGDSAQYLLFRKNKDALPDLDQVLLNPREAKVPEEGHFKYAVASGLANRANKNNMGAALEYAARLTKPFEVLFVSLATKIHDGLTECPEFIRWATDKSNREAVL